MKLGNWPQTQMYTKGSTQLGDGSVSKVLAKQALGINFNPPEFTCKRLGVAAHACTCRPV